MAHDHERLDVEDDEERMSRIQNTLQKMSTGSSPKGINLPPGLPRFDFGDRTTYAVPPPTELLSRLQSFLPQLEASNAILASCDPTTFSIELPAAEDAPYIEMNLGLGVFEDKTAGLDDAEMEESTSSDSSLSLSSSSSSSEEEREGRGYVDSDEEEESEDEMVIINTAYVPPPRRFKPLPKRARSAPGIVVLGEEGSKSQSPSS